MCGSLRLENQSKINPGDSIKIGQISYKWDGFARSDGKVNGTKTMAQQFSPKSWKVVVLPISGFTEKGKDGKIYDFKAKQIGILVSEQEGTLRIITRPAKTDHEKLAHHRMPSRVPATMSKEEYLRLLNQKTGGDYEYSS